MNKKLFALRIALALTGALVLFEGGLFADRTTPVAIVLGIVGLCLITSSKKTHERGC